MPYLPTRTRRAGPRAPVARALRPILTAPFAILLGSVSCTTGQAPANEEPDAGAGETTGGSDLDASPADPTTDGDDGARDPDSDAERDAGSDSARDADGSELPPDAASGDPLDDATSDLGRDLALDPATDALDSPDSDASLPASDPFTPIDAVLLHPNGKAYFFAGAAYTRYDLVADAADAGYPLPIARWWPGLWEDGVDAAVAAGADLLFFRDGDVVRYDPVADAARAGYPRAIAEEWPDLWSDGIDAAVSLAADRLWLFRDGEARELLAESGAVVAPVPIGEAFPGVWVDGVDAALSTASERIYFFRGDEYLRWNAVTRTVDPGYPRETRWWWPGLPDPHEGTGDNSASLPSSLSPLLRERPGDDELEARRARVRLSAEGSYADLSASYPLYLASIEERLGVYGCGILRSLSDPSVYRFRCATNQDGPARLEIEPFRVEFIDWASAAHHVEQVSQGDFMANAGTPLSIFGTDDGLFHIVSLTTNSATGSIVAGTNVRVGFTRDGEWQEIGFSHLNDHVPGYVLDAYAAGEPLEAGTVFGFIGYTGNLWMAAPPEEDAPYSGSGAGLPVAHSHLWFVESSANHMTLTPSTRESIDYSGRYPYGGG